MRAPGPTQAGPPANDDQRCGGPGAWSMFLLSFSNKRGHGITISLQTYQEQLARRHSTKRHFENYIIKIIRSSGTTSCTRCPSVVPSTTMPTPSLLRAPRRAPGQGGGQPARWSHAGLRPGRRVRGHTSQPLTLPRPPRRVFRIIRATRLSAAPPQDRISCAATSA